LPHTAADAPIRRRLIVRGTVQGVGFRPHVARLAGDLGLRGTCRNDTSAVEIEVTGPAGVLDSFVERLVAQAPRLARIESVTDAPPGGQPLPPIFVIAESAVVAGARTMVPADTALCPDCERELADPADRRYRHPFITCTHCGPRLTIILDLPYDRSATTMAGFPLCPACAREYADPADRRYHAQPVACHDCGPRLRLRSAAGEVVADSTEEVLSGAIGALRAGRIVAVKGLGGYHLACDATNPTAVADLRRRKGRPDQPFAVMVATVEDAATLVEVGGAADLLTGPERPIVLLLRRGGAPVADGVAPGLHELGILLPYTPLHHLLFAPTATGEIGPRALVMTSGNATGEPLCVGDDEALDRLGSIADLFVTHDREIAVPVEDSVIAWDPATGPVPVRRSRGYAPVPVDLGPVGTVSPVVLAAGAELKNTVALARDGRAFVSAHVGDLASWATRQAHASVTEQLVRFHRRSPGLIVADRHPGYASTAWARRYAATLDVPLLEVQHHHAHLASLAAEHGRLGEDLLGLVFDGTGYGCDATIWGGELLRLTNGGARAERLGHLGPVRLPGGDAGVRNPVRTAALALLDAGMPLSGTGLEFRLSRAEISVLSRAHERGLGVSVTSSMGRLIDVAAALLGVRHRVSYEAQAAIELEDLAASWRRAHPGARPPALPLPVVDAPTPWLDPAPFVRALAGAARVGEQAASDPIGGIGGWAYAVHAAIADGAADLALTAVARTGIGVVGLSGGVFVNRLLLTVTTERLRAAGVEVVHHRVVPANDGGLALGQVAVGWRHLMSHGSQE